MYRTASIRSLAIQNYHQPANLVKELIKWPKSLIHFSFSLYQNPELTLDMPTLATWLAIHKDTLKSLKLGYLPSNNIGPVLHTTDFPNLETLTLSTLQFGNQHYYHISYDDAQDLISGPRLYTIILDMSWHAQNHNPRRLGFHNERCIRYLAHAAKENKAALRELIIIYNPMSATFLESDHNIYPWKSVERLQRETEGLGVKLRCTPPPLSRKEWEEVVVREENALITERYL